MTSMSFHPTGDFILVGTEHPTSELLSDNFLSVRLNGLSYREVQKSRAFEKSGFHCVYFLPLFCFICLFIYFFAVRLYDTSTGQCFVPANPREYHTGSINMVSTD